MEAVLKEASAKKSWVMKGASVGKEAEKVLAFSMARNYRASQVEWDRLGQEVVLELGPGVENLGPKLA